MFWLFFSCNNSNKEIHNIDIAKSYYQVLNESNISEISHLISDSLGTKELGYDYTQVFSKARYIDWLKWDAVFKPSYKILEINDNKQTIKAKISKTDQLILFLHKAPTVFEQTLYFKNGKITTIENKNVIFNDSIWVKNRTEFLNWIDQNHPELNGFIFDQTEEGGLKYLKAISLYNAQ